MNVALTSLWLPILLSAVVVFIVSSLIWAVIGYHNSDWQKLPDEDAARSALRGTGPGQYSLPHAADNKAKASEEWQAKFKEGPAAMITIVPHGSLGMNKQLGLWFVYCLAVSFLIAYVAAAALTADATYLQVFRITATVGVLTYAGAAPFGVIWFGHTTGRMLKDILDGLIYGLATAGIFGWLWP